MRPATSTNPALEAALEDAPFVVAALYKFMALPNFADYREPLLKIYQDADLSGTVLLAHEGINGTVAGTAAGIDQALSAMQQLLQIDALEHKKSYAMENPFLRLKVRLKKEIVTMGVPNIDPTLTVGTYVNPEDWNDLINDPDVVLIDTRNDYEVGIGTFRGAINPKTKTFRDFPDWFKNQDALQREALQGKKVAMFCTGGIRCEKSTAFAKQRGFDDVFHLKGGILKYLETVPEEDSEWTGECFVFDQRVSVKHGLELGHYDQCYACRNPIDEADMASPQYVLGVSCPKCFDSNDAETKQRFQERQKQMELAKRRGEKHIGQVYEVSPKGASTSHD